MLALMVDGSLFALSHPDPHMIGILIVDGFVNLDAQWWTDIAQFQSCRIIGKRDDKFVRDK